MTAPEFADVRVVLLDIEGTTTPISFVYDTLFPYARKHLRPFLSLQAGNPEVAHALTQLRAERDADPSSAAKTDAAYAELLMDRDSKSPGLKAIQGMIWNIGYTSGVLRGEVFDDVPAALRRWRAAGVRTAIYSSGSVQAQRLIFGTTQFGDLTSNLDGFFDTAVGAKREASSYRAIAQALRCDTANLLFVSDVMPEISAAAAAGCQVALVVRPGNPAQSGVGSTAVVETLSAIELKAS